MTIMKILNLQVFEIYDLCFASCNRTFSTRPRKHASIVKGVSARQETHVRPFRGASNANVCHVLQLPDLVTELCAISSRESCFSKAASASYLRFQHTSASNFTLNSVIFNSSEIESSVYNSTVYSRAEKSAEKSPVFWRRAVFRHPLEQCVNLEYGLRSLAQNGNTEIIRKYRENEDTRTQTKGVGREGFSSLGRTHHH